MNDEQLEEISYLEIAILNNLNVELILVSGNLILYIFNKELSFTYGRQNAEIKIKLEMMVEDLR
jgi:hypothetical protein